MKWYPAETLSEVTINEGDLPCCCSVLVLGEAEFNGDAGSLDKAMKAGLQGEFMEFETKGLLLYTLNEEQTIEKKVLLDNGFEPLTSYVSPSTKSTITLYALKVNQPKAPAKRPRAAKRRR
jgi:hypothetical protein